jgi:hypothetical protein
MAYGFDDPMMGTQTRLQKRGGGARAFLGLMLAAAGVGFSGYVYFVPYKKLASVIEASKSERDQANRAAQGALAERDKLKAEIVRRDAQDKDRASSEGKKKALADGMAGELKAALGTMGATVAAGGGKVTVSFPVSAVFEQPTSTAISTGGMTALRVLAASLKRIDSQVRVKARLSSAPPPRELAQFRNVGEFAMLRAARISLALVDGGVSPGRVAAAGESPGGQARKGKTGLPDRLDIEIEPD